MTECLEGFLRHVCVPFYALQVFSFVFVYFLLLLLWNWNVCVCLCVRLSSCLTAEASRGVLSPGGGCFCHFISFSFFKFIYFTLHLCQNVGQN